MCALNVMIVEDEALVAAELEWMVVDAGHRCVGSAIDADEALELAAAHKPDLALVDVHLSDGPTGVETARRLAEGGAQIIFMTANPKRIPADCAGALGVLSKPYAPGGVRQALDYAASLGEPGEPRSPGMLQPLSACCR